MAAIGFVVAGMIVRTWGVGVYGFLTVMRSFLLVGTMSLLDPCLSETTTISVAKARARGYWAHAKQTVWKLYTTSILIAATTFIFFYLSSESILYFINIDREMYNIANNVVFYSLLSNFLAYPARVSEGIIIGFEDYFSKRIIEVITAAIFLTSVIIGIYLQVGILFLALAYIFSISIRSIALILRSLHFMPLRLAADLRYRRSLTTQLAKRSWLLTQNQFLGAAPQYATPILISAIISPAAVGIYDLSLRLPRLMKMILALVPSALLPIIPRIRLAEYSDKAQTLMKFGYSIVPALTMPGIVMLAASSSRILAVWLGPEMAQYWHWSVVGFIPIILSQFTLLPGMNLVDKPAAYVENNRISALQTLLAFGAGSILCILYGAFGFIFANAAAHLIFFHQKYRNIAVAVGADLHECLQKVVIIAAPNLTALIVMLAFQSSLTELSLQAFSLLATAIMTVCMLTMFFFVLESDERKLVKDIARQSMGKK